MDFGTIVLAFGLGAALFGLLLLLELLVERTAPEEAVRPAGAVFIEEAVYDRVAVVAHVQTFVGGGPSPNIPVRK